MNSMISMNGTNIKHRKASDRGTYMRMRYLPDQINATRHKLRALENEARRYGMTELLDNPGDASCEV